ncbi:MAG: DUF481 domain-containing protein [Candidatus Latescibacterota bacterium]|nr:MAG: DUF481 domain-containing protein [Candidatus Latescibacterota bacterium]
MNRIHKNGFVGVTLLVIAVLLAPTFGGAVAFAQTWQPPEPSTAEKDWLKMKSGEWLWGELKGLRDKDLDFDSDEFDMQTVDIDDVAEFRSARVLTYRFEEAGVFTGTAVIRDGIVKIQTDTGVQELPTADLIMILEGTQKEIDFWSAKATLGWVGRSGNTDQVDFNSSFRVRRQSPRSRWDNRYNGNLGEVSGEQTINNQNFVSSLDMLLREGFFITPVAINLFHDKFQNIDLRTTLAAGAGYVFMRGGDVDWQASLSAGYVHTQYVSVQEGADDAEGSFSLIPATDLEWDITGDIEFLFDYNLQMAVPETRNSFHHAAGTISFDIWGDILDLDFSLVWDRVESPTPKEDGTIPARDDFRSTFGIGLDL